MLIHFSKMQAQGNDFVILNLMDHELDGLDYPRLAAEICRAHFGVGADGLVLISPSLKADARMIIYNSDGSLAEICGSALRCVSQILMQRLKRDKVLIWTDAGLKSATRKGEEITVNLGTARILDRDLTVEGFTGDLVNIGNPHFVIFLPDLKDDPHLRYGPILERHLAFPASVNVHFAQVKDPGLIRMKIWENAVGATLACGTGAAATVFSGIRRGLLSPNVRVQVPGGEIGIRYTKDEDSLLLSGPVTEVFCGSYPWKI